MGWGGTETLDPRPSSLVGGVLGPWEVGPYEGNRARNNSWRCGVEEERMLKTSDVRYVFREKPCSAVQTFPHAPSPFKSGAHLQILRGERVFLVVKERAKVGLLTDAHWINSERSERAPEKP